VDRTSTPEERLRELRLRAVRLPEAREGLGSEVLLSHHRRRPAAHRSGRDLGRVVARDQDDDGRLVRALDLHTCMIC